MFVTWKLAPPLSCTSTIPLWTTVAAPLGPAIAQSTTAIEAPPGSVRVIPTDPMSPGGTDWAPGPGSSPPAVPGAPAEQLAAPIDRQSAIASRKVFEFTMGALHAGGSQARPRP